MDIPGFLLFCVFLHDFQKNMRFWNQIRRLWYFFKLTLESVKVYRFHVRTMHTLLRQAVHDIIHIMSWTAFLNEKMYDRRTIRKSRGNWKSEDSGKTENLLAVPVWLREYMHRGRFSPEKRTYEELWMQKTDPTPGKTPRSHRTAVRQACRSGTGSGNGRKMWWRSGAKRIVRRGSRGSSGHRGVYRRENNRWRASIGFQGKSYNLGSFATYEEAVQARLDAEKRLYDPFLAKYREENSWGRRGITILIKTLPTAGIPGSFAT